MSLQMVELHFATKPNSDYAAIKLRAQEILDEELDASHTHASNNSCLYIHKNYPIQLKDAVIAPQTALLRASKTIDIKNYQDDIQQSWRFRECDSILIKSKSTILVTELMTQGLEYKDRVRLFHGVLQAAIEVTKPIAMVFKYSQQVVHPEDYLDCIDRDPIFRPGSLNVRFFNISNSAGDMLMDTRGLTEIGLHDLQCHFHDLDPNDVSNLLFNMAAYIFENGPIVESGNTVAGIEEGSKWKCQFENALVSPEREVLDLNPGPLYAAGGRE